MTKQQSEWNINLEPTDATAYAVLVSDRIWNGYSLCNLDEPLRQYARVALASKRNKRDAAACVVLQHPDFSAIVTHGDASGVATLLQTYDDLPASTVVLARQSHLPAIETQFHFATARHAMIRMAVDRKTFQPSTNTMSEVQKLTVADLPALEELYASYAANLFSVDQLRSGIFYGVRDGDTIVAAGGTHAISQRYGIAAIGSIYTRPEGRGKGYATAISSAVVTELFQCRCSEVILNVAEANQTAQRLYQRLGFQQHCQYWEGQARRRESSR